MDIPAQPTPTEEIEPLGYITFVVRASDFINLEESAQTLNALADLFDANGVKGELFLTGPMTRRYAEDHPMLVQRLIDSNLTISYHVQPPHPLVPGFQAPFQSLPVNVTQERVREYESMALDLATGKLEMDNPGGYRYLTEMFGSPPAAVSIPDTWMRGFALPILHQLGAQVVVLREGGTTSLDPPLQQEYGMWVRPADIHLSHWTTEGVDAAMAWWDMLSSEYAGAYQPVVKLESTVESWAGERLPYIVVTMDEYNFYRQGPPPWTMVYYHDPSLTQPNPPPFDLGSPDLSSPRSPEDQAGVWEAYRLMVEWASTYLQVITAGDIPDLASAGG